MRQHPLPLVLLAALVAAVACQPPAPAPEPVPEPTVIQANAARVDIPAGAIATTADLAIATVDLPVPLPSGHDVRGSTWALTPHGTHFLKPVTLTLPAPAESGLVVMRLDDPSDTTWEEVPSARFENGSAVAAIDHFSFYAVVQRTVQPCANNGGCDPNADCAPAGEGRTCTCKPGFTGDGITCSDVNECLADNGGCDQNANCINSPGARFCICMHGFEGDGFTCTDIDECATDHGGCHPLATCTNTDGWHECTCPEGYWGDGVHCTDYDECQSLHGGCSADADCTNTPGSRTCTCKPGYQGDGLTCSDVDECLTNNGGCDAHATCANTVGGRTCACNAGYLGDGLTCQRPPSGPFTQTFGSTGVETGNALAVDPSGNLLIAGGTTGAMAGTNAGGKDLFVTKRDSGGLPLWTRQLGTSGDDEAFGVASDAQGNVYVSGTTAGAFDGHASAGGTDLVVVKFDPNGTKLWSVQLGSSANDDAGGITVSPQNEVYVVGAVRAAFNGGTFLGGSDALLVKLSAAGSLVWSRQSGNYDADAFNAVVCDAQGNVYVGGNEAEIFYDMPNYPASVAARFDAAGNQIWKTLSRVVRAYNVGTSLALDGSGKLALAGWVDGNIQGLGNVRVVQFQAATGAIDWTLIRDVGETDRAGGVVYRDDGSLLVAGHTDGDLVKRSPPIAAGTFTLAVSATGTAGTLTDGGPGTAARALVRDGAGNLYLVGDSNGDVLLRRL